MELSLEQQFLIRSFEDSVATLSREDAIAHLVTMYKTMLIRESQYRSLIKQEMGL
jgi:hypothetical protein